MTGKEQRDALQRQIWKIANDVRGSIDGWDFKQYVLGTLFYRFISENFANYIEGGDDSINYAEMSDDIITPEIKNDAIKTKGYFIYPSQLFINVTKTANTNESLNTDLAEIFAAIEASANGYPSESDIKGLFADFDTTSNRLGPRHGLPLKDRKSVQTGASSMVLSSMRVAKTSHAKASISTKQIALAFGCATRMPRSSPPTPAHNDKMLRER